MAVGSALSPENPADGKSLPLGESAGGSVERPPVPTIYSRIRAPAQMTVAARLASLAVGCACAAVLVTAARLTPSPTGTGTHTELHLQACQFKLRTGLPCPSCGMTTSFSY